MTTDQMIVAGILLVALSSISLINAWTHGHVPRVGAVMVLTGVVLIVLATRLQPGGYGFDDLPGAFRRVFGGFRF